MNRFLKLTALFSPFALPLVSLAQGPQFNTGFVVPGTTNASTILGTISSIFAVVIPILITLAVIYVIWGVIKYATASDDDAQTMARQTIIKGVIALFVIVSIWGLVAIINRTFGVEQSGTNVGACQPIWDPVDQDFEVPPQCL